MRVVATGTGDFPLAKRHMRRAHQLRPAHLMTLKADLHLRLLDELTVLRQGLGKTASYGERLHHLVTGHTGHAARFVRTPLPEQPQPLFVALQALNVLFFSG